VEAAVRFFPETGSSGKMRSIRVATTLLTNRAAAAVLNELGMPGETESSYRYVNVHNPCCPLYFEATRKKWSCTPDFENHPVWGINWAGALLVCQHLGGRLPLAQEWECFASNNEPTKIYPWGDDPPTKSLANFGEHFGGTSQVASFPPSEIGLYDLAGNLSEWCQDSHSTSFERVAKGGAWSKDAHYLKIATRRSKWERLGTTTIGLRLVWDD